MRLKIAVLCIALLAFTLFPAAQASDTTVAHEVEKKMETSTEPVEVFVNLKKLNGLMTQRTREHQTTISQQRLIDYAESTEGIRVLKDFWITNSVLVEIDPRYDHEKLTRIDGVRSLSPNAQMGVLGSSSLGLQNSSTGSTTDRSPTTTQSVSTKSTDTTYGIQQINATDVWSQYNTQGEDVRVAILDTGVNVSHPDIELRTTDPSNPTYPGGWAEFDSNGNRVTGSEPHDTGTHGTHVTGTVGGEHTGVAPNASLMHALVVNDGSGGTYARVIAGMEWAVENDADVVSISLGGDKIQSTWIDAVENANQMGTVVIAATGNYNQGGDGRSSTPGNVYDVLGVGAVDTKLEVPGFSGGELLNTDSTWGSSAPEDWPNQYVVPDIVAAGLSVNSTSANGGYEIQSGTSMATPHVAGATALALSATGDKSPDRVTDAFALTAFGSGSEEPGTRYGHGVADALAVTEHLIDDASVSGTVVNGSGTPINDANVTVDGLRVDSTGGSYDVGLTSGSWDLEVSAPGYQDTTETVTFEQDENVRRDIQLQKTPDGNTPPKASFTYSPNSPQTSETVTFDASASSDTDGTVQGYDWDFGDGTTATGETVSHSYGSSGDYVVELTVTDGSGATDTGTETVSVQSPNQEPTASFTYSPSSPDTSDSIIFDASGSSDTDGRIQSYDWDFGDGTTDIITSDATQHLYTAPGDYTVELTVTDNEGATDTETETVSVQSSGGDNTLPMASFTYSPNSPETSDTVSFDASGSSDSDGSVVQYEWDVDGDGVIEYSSSMPTVSHSYTSSGTYTVELTVTDDDGDSVSTGKTVFIRSPNSPPTASFTYQPDSPDTSDTVSFDASGSSDLDGTITSYEWNFGDGTTAGGETRSHSYADADTFTVTLTVTDDTGATGTTTQTVSVSSSPSNSPPIAEFSITSDTPQTGETVSFDASNSSDPDGTVTSYTWNFGDGTTTTGETALHSYSTPGSYTIELTVTDDDGATASTNTTVSVSSSNTAPTASFTYSPSKPETSDTVTFDASGSLDSDGVIQSYDWDFGDGTTATGETVSHSYSNPGDYTATLTVTDDDGETDTETQTVSVTNSDTASIDDIQTTVSDTDGDGLTDKIEAEVTVSKVTSGQTTVTLGEANFEVDVSPTDTGQALFVTPNDTDGDGTDEEVEFVDIPPSGESSVDATYTVVANLSGQSDGETGTVTVELGGGTTDSESYTVTEATGSLSPDNPFGEANNDPLPRGDVITKIIDWNRDQNNELDGTQYTRQEIIGFIVEWNRIS